MIFRHQQNSRNQLLLVKLPVNDQIESFICLFKHSSILIGKIQFPYPLNNYNQKKKSFYASMNTSNIFFFRRNIVINFNERSFLSLNKSSNHPIKTVLSPKTTIKQSWRKWLLKYKHPPLVSQWTSFLHSRQSIPIEWIPHGFGSIFIPMYENIVENQSTDNWRICK